MLLDLVVRELEHLQTIRKRCLRRFRICEVVDDALVRISLLDIVVVEVDDCVSVWEDLTLDTVIEDYFLLSILVESLDLSIVTNNLFYYLHVAWRLVVIFLWELHVVVFFFFLHVRLLLYYYFLFRDNWSLAGLLLMGWLSCLGLSLLSQLSTWLLLLVLCWQLLYLLLHLELLELLLNVIFLLDSRSVGLELFIPWIICLVDILFIILLLVIVLILVLTLHWTADSQSSFVLVLQNSFRLRLLLLLLLLLVKSVPLVLSLSLLLSVLLLSS